MPTIDELAPATAASDTDELLASQSGVTRKVTRAQVISGLQPALAVPAGSLLGRESSGVGAPEVITVGPNLVLNAGTLSASPTYVVSALPTGTVPVGADLVAMGQGGTNTAVSYAQFLNGISGVPGIDASQMTVTAAGASQPETLAAFASAALLTSGGTLTGALVLDGDPTAPLQASTKQYVDAGVATALPLSGGAVSGALTLAADPAAPLQAATKQYVDAAAAASLPTKGGTLQGPLTLAADPAGPLQAATKQYVDAGTAASVPKAGGVMTGSLTLVGNPAAGLQAAPKQYVDSQVATALPLSGGALTGALTLAADPAAPSQAATKHYVDNQITTALPLSGGTLGGALTLAGDPVAGAQAATKHYVDTQTGALLPLSGGTLTGALTLVGDPVAPLQPATKHYVDTAAVSGLPVTGGTLTGPLTLAADPVAPLQAATKHYVDTSSASGLPVTGGTLTGPLILAADPVSSLQAATKEYVDGQVAAALPKAGGVMTGALAMGANQLSGSSISFTGGTLDGVTIGGTTQAPLKATTGAFSGTLSVGSTISLGTGVPPGGNCVVVTPNGSNIVFNPQGTGQVSINAGLSAYSLNFSQPRSWNGAGEQALLTYNSTWSGTNSSSNPTALHAFFQSSVGVASTGGATIYGIYTTLNSSSSTTKGNILGVNSGISISAPTGNGSVSPGATYSAGHFQIDFMSNDNGTPGSPVGLACVMNLVMHWGPSATYTGGGSAMEVDIYAEAGSSLMDKIGVIIVNLGGDAVLGSRDNMALCFDGGGGTIGWPSLISVGRKGGRNPLSSNGWIMTCTPTGGVGTMSGAGGLDFSSFRPTVAYMRGNGFLIDPSGAITGSSLISTGAVLRQAMTSSSPGSGSTISVATGISDYRILGTGPLAALTIALPPSPTNGLLVRVSSQVAVTALTVTDSTGVTSTVQTAPATLPAGGAFSAQWNAAASTWWCCVGA